MSTRSRPRRAAWEQAGRPGHRPDADDEAAFNRAAAEVGVVFVRRREESLYLNRIMCLRCGEVWIPPKDVRVRWVGWHQRESLPRAEREFRFRPLAESRHGWLRCPNGCNAP